MKKLLIIFAIFLFTGIAMQAQETVKTSAPMIGAIAPSFTAESTNGTINFPADYIYKWKILFSHPADFTPVCSSELLELAGRQQEFTDLGAKIIVISADPLENHESWKKSMESIPGAGDKTYKINFPLVDDENLTISKEYGMLQPSSNSTKDVRGVFIIDPSNKIRAVFYYPMEVGRNIDEIKRTLQALQLTDKRQVLTPVDWQPGGDVMLPFIGTEKDSKKGTLPPDTYQKTWYMTYQKGVSIK